MMRPSPTVPKRSFRANDDGVTAIEFAFVAPMLMLFVIGIVEVGLLVAGQQMLEDATFVGSRTSKIGYTAAGSTQEATILASIRQAAGAYLDPGKITITSKAYADYGNVGQPEPFTDVNKNGKRDAGEPYTDVNGNGSYDSDQGKSGHGKGGEIVVFTTTYPWRLHTPLISDLMGAGGVYTLRSRAVVKNEPY